MKYAFETLSEDDFEKLVVKICQSLLGIGIHSFTKGRDGGRDGYFEGVAQKYPSTKQPWQGKFIIQAKHTTKVMASCSDNEFFSNKTSVINKEIERLKEISLQYPFDCYLLFTNRPLSGDVHPKIKKHLEKELNISNADIIGQEDLERYVDDCPELIRQFNLLKYMLPDRFGKQDIRDVIILFSQQGDDWLKNQKNGNGDGNEKNCSPFEYIEKERKNELNNVSDVYFEDIKQHSLRFFRDIEAFLEDPRNREYKIKYVNTASELRGFILSHYQKYTFMELLEEIIYRITGDDTTQEVHRVKALVRVFVHFMYWNCDIGRTPSNN